MMPQAVKMPMSVQGCLRSDWNGISTPETPSCVVGVDGEGEDVQGEEDEGQFGGEVMDQPDERASSGAVEEFGGQTKTGHDGEPEEQIEREARGTGQEPAEWAE